MKEKRIKLMWTRNGMSYEKELSKREIVAIFNTKTQISRKLLHAIQIAKTIYIDYDKVNVDCIHYFTSRCECEGIKLLINNRYERSAWSELCTEGKRLSVHEYVI